MEEEQKQEEVKEKTQLERTEEIVARQEAANAKTEELMAKQMLSGKATAGQEEEKPKEESSAEYRQRIEKEASQGKYD